MHAYELESAEDYIRKVFSLDVNTSYHSTTFHRVARGFVGDASLEAALAKELLSKIKFAPRVISHGNTIQFAPSTFVVICHRSLGQIISELNTSQVIRRKGCFPLLTMAEADLVTGLQMDSRLARNITRQVGIDYIIINC